MDADEIEADHLTGKVLGHFPAKVSWREQSAASRGPDLSSAPTVDAGSRLPGILPNPVAEAWLAGAGLSSGRPLDAATRDFFEPRMGVDLSGARLHTGPKATASARSVEALGYTMANHIVMGDQYIPGTTAARRLLAHELLHVVQQGRPGEAVRLARAADPMRKTRSVDLQDLHDTLVKLLKSLNRRTQMSVLGWKTIALGLAELTDENGAKFQTLVYTASNNWDSRDLEAKAAALGITHWKSNPRVEGSGPVGAPEDAEQLMDEASFENDATILGRAVSRKMCPDCAEAAMAEDVQTIIVDPSKHLPRRVRPPKNPSAALEAARAEVNVAFMPQAVAPGQEESAGLGPKSSLWPALNVLNMRELFVVAEEADRAGRLKQIMAKAGKAEGVDNNRILAPMDVIFLRNENLHENPEHLAQVLVGSLLAQRLALLPPDQASFLLNQLSPQLKLAAPPKSPPQRQRSAPKEQSPTEKAKESDSLLASMVKVLTATGVTLTTVDAIVSSLATIATKIFTDVVLRRVVAGASGPAKDAIRVVVEEAEKDLPKLRVLGEKTLHELPGRIADELGPIVEKWTSVGHGGP